MTNFLAQSGRASAYEEIKADLINPVAKPNEVPRALLLAAQHGAGKSTLLRSVHRQFPDLQFPVVINWQELREKHPRFNEMSHGNAPQIAQSISKEIFQWMQWLLRDATQAKLHVIMEATLQQPDTISHFAKDLYNSGYKLEIHCMAVHWRQSMLGMFSRCEEGIRTTGATRWPVRPAHNEAYECTAASLNILARSNIFEGAFVYRRDGTQIHAASEITTETIEAIENERNRNWTETEKQQHLERWNGLLHEVSARSGPKPDWYVESMETEARRANQSLGDVYEGEHLKL